MLTKSNYMHGLQCPKLMWHAVRKMLPPPSETSLVRMQAGQDIGKYAHKIYPDGILLPDDFKQNLEATKKNLGNGKTLFEASIISGEFYSKADILHPETGGYELIEVKSSTSVKEEHYADVSFQRFCFEQGGVKIKKSYLMHLNNKYVKQGEIEPAKLFVKEEIEQEPVRAEEMLSLCKGECPNIKIGAQCYSPRECPLIPECWKEVPEENVFCLVGSWDRAEALFSKGIVALKDVPPGTTLNEKQEIQVAVAKSGKPHIDHKAIKNFLSSIHEPISYLDFETFAPGVPLIDGTRPYQKIAFQYSLHTADKHLEFLGDELDARRKFMESLKKDLPATGSILVYNATFEKGVLRELAQLFPEYKKWVDSVNIRMVDLLLPFKEFYYYHPSQEGRTSIKCVLPALCGKSYSGMDIANGEEASNAYPVLVETKDPKLRADMLKYCELDTLGMKMIVEKLRSIVAEKVTVIS